jgi:hypothetical protein
MTVDERVHLAMSGLRLRTDELGRPPSHDEVAELLRRVVQEAEDEAAEELRRVLRDIDAYCVKQSLTGINDSAFEEISMMVDRALEGGS